MKKTQLRFTFLFLSIFPLVNAQTFSPITTTGYNFDAVAEAVTASATTTGPLDGSNFVLYSAAYGALYSAAGGLPNNGVIASGTRTYQLQSYTVNNMCYTPGGTTDSILFANPASYAGLSILCFSTEGAGTMNVTVRFTDNTTQVFSNQNLIDWFGTGTAIISGFDRVSRSTGTPAGVSGNPKMFNLDFVISCANRSKLVSNIKFQNTSTNPRNCIMAVSGAAIPSFTTASTAVTCSGGNNGSATITPLDGIAPFTYTWSTVPPQFSTGASSLAVGVYSYIAMDAALCPVNGTINITQSLVAQPALTVSANVYTVCAGAPVILTSAGAVSYTWNTTNTGNTLAINPASSSVYTVSGLTNFNCLRTGSVAITANPLPVINFTTPSVLCLNAPQVLLNASPAGGTYAGAGITFGTFFPNLAGVGTKTLSYTYTDANNCTSVAGATIFVNPLPAINFSVSVSPLCTNSPTLLLNATPLGGTYSGSGVTGNIYSPSLAGAGSPTVSYTFTDANNCTATSISTATINAAPSPFFQTTKKLFCTFTPSLVLNASPSGGIFSGAGTSSNGGFSPSAAGVGTHSITYTYTDGNNCSGKAVISMTVSACTGIDESATDTEKIKVFPNPNNGSFTVIANKNTTLLLVNEIGQIIRSYTINESDPSLLIINDLSPGLYLIYDQNSPSGFKQKILVTN